MSRVEDIILRVRETLGDLTESRWETASLLRRLNEGQYDISKKTGLFKTSVGLPIVMGQATYTMPADFIRLKEVLYKYTPIPVVLSQQMVKRFGPTWRVHSSESDIIAVMLDRADARTIRVYPRPFIDTITNYTQSSFVGTLGALSGYDADAYFGVVDYLADKSLFEHDVETYGTVSDIFEELYITIEYVRRAAKILDVSEDPELPDVFDTALVRYVTGVALRDDIDVQNRSMGNEELILYQNELTDIYNVSYSNSATSACGNTTEYRGIG